MEQQQLRIREILDKLPKSQLIELLLADTPQQTQTTFNVKPNRLGRRWSNKEDQYAIQAYKQGLTAEQIADVLGRTESGVYNRLHELRNQGVL